MVFEPLGTCTHQVGAANVAHKTAAAQGLEAQTKARCLAHLDQNKRGVWNHTPTPKRSTGPEDELIVKDALNLAVHAFQPCLATTLPEGAD